MVSWEDAGLGWLIPGGYSCNPARIGTHERKQSVSAVMLRRHRLFCSRVPLLPFVSFRLFLVPRWNGSSFSLAVAMVSVDLHERLWGVLVAGDMVLHVNRCAPGSRGFTWALAFRWVG